MFRSNSEKKKTAEIKLLRNFYFGPKSNDQTYFEVAVSPLSRFDRRLAVAKQREAGVQKVLGDVDVLNAEVTFSTVRRIQPEQHLFDALTFCQAARCQLFGHVTR